MNDEAIEMVGVELSKINFLLENLYALVLSGHGASPRDVELLSEELCRQCEEVPGTTYGREVGEDDLRARLELVSQRIAMFFSGVRTRLTKTDKSQDR